MAHAKNTDSIGNQFETTDLGLAASLSASGYNVIGIDKENPKRVVFLFPNTPSLIKAVSIYWNGSMQLPASTLLEHIRLLKNRIYSSN